MPASSLIHRTDTPPQEPAFMIRNIPVHGRLILAPMDGYSNHPFRLICRRWGSAITYSEFINAVDLEGKNPHIASRLYFHEEERPFGYQILDNNSDRILWAAQQLRLKNPDFLDLNLGCCSRQVCSRGAGASLLLEPEKISEILHLLVTNLDIPITAKIRLGWDDTKRNYLEIARRIQDSGASAIAVHGRTRVQAYTGQADWDAIAEIKQTLHIPVIGNGDVKNPMDIDNFLSHTGCNAIMIGRAAIGNPWIFSKLSRSDFGAKEIFQTMREHLLATMAYYGNEHGLMIFRKHTVEYMKEKWPTTEVRKDILTTADWQIFLTKIQNILSDKSTIG